MSRIAGVKKTNVLCNLLIALTVFAVTLGTNTDVLAQQCESYSKGGLWCYDNTLRSHEGGKIWAKWTWNGRKGKGKLVEWTGKHIANIRRVNIPNKAWPQHPLRYEAKTYGTMTYWISDNLKVYSSASRHSVGECNGGGEQAAIGCLCAAISTAGMIRAPANDWSTKPEKKSQKKTERYSASGMATLRVFSDHPRSKVYINGKRAGTTPRNTGKPLVISDTPIGRVTVSVKKRKRQWEGTVNVQSGKFNSVEAELLGPKEFQALKERTAREKQRLEAERRRKLEEERRRLREEARRKAEEAKKNRKKRIEECKSRMWRDIESAQERKCGKMPRSGNARDPYVQRWFGCAEKVRDRYNFSECENLR